MPANSAVYDSFLRVKFAPPRTTRPPSRIALRVVRDVAFGSWTKRICVCAARVMT